ncbi:MAG: PqqD family protein [Nitrospira sp.]|nr:PqqD family protein [Nitrospira sp.]MCA9465879.1 PqqD family protein [Nitrospira sp.]MCA9476823.1 PqqD family protein [Nitrospira sp.]MCA9479601.1 PqqD family protein [Nitrospira sp.]
MTDQDASQKKELFIGSELRPKVGGNEDPDTSCVASDAGNQEIEAEARRAMEKSGSPPPAQPKEWEDLRDSRLQAHEDVHCSILEGEAVLLNLDNGMYYSLNRVGTAIWELCDGQFTVSEILARICDRFDVAEEQAKQDLTVIASQLLEQHLLVKIGS